MRKRSLAAAALAAVLAIPAVAQQALQPPAMPDMNDTAAGTPDGSMMTAHIAATKQQAGFIQNQRADDWRGSKLIGASVYGPDNSSIGEINDVLIGNNGAVRAVVVSVGGFLGIGEKNVALPFEGLDIERSRSTGSISKIKATYSKKQLKAAPRFAFYEVGSPQTTGAGERPLAPTPK